MRVAVVVVALAAAMPATAKDFAPPVSIRPMHRPEAAIATPVPPVAAKTATPLPGQRNVLRLGDAAYGECLGSLRQLGVVFEEVAPVIAEDDADCGIVQPVKVSALAQGVAIVPAAVMRCPTAQALAAWMRDFVQPAAGRLEGRGALTGVDSGSGYICRRRNNLQDGALSEHAFGNAFDVMGFRFANGPAVMVKAPLVQDSLDSAFVDAVRAAACLDFATVLGPGSNAAHDDHLHLDIMARDGGFRLCELRGTVAK